VRLARRALEILLKTLCKENTVSPRQRKALAQMLEGMARQATGQDTGRYAYGLPCGGGKTQGAIALIVAAWELGLGLSFAVSTAQVEPLCEFKRQLMAHGIPEHDIGLWHSLKVDPARAKTEVACASLPATPSDDDRPILLLSQEKVRRGAVPMFKGEPYSLLIWDESLLATEARYVSIPDIELAAGIARQRAPDAAPFLEKIARAAMTERDALRADPGRLPAVLDEVLSGDELTTMRTALDAIHDQGDYVRVMKGTSNDLLRLLERPVSVAETGNGNRGDGVLRYEVVVSPKLGNIAILDASHAIRLLSRADCSITERTSREMREYRRYDNVTVRQVRVRAGKRYLCGAQAATLEIAKLIAGAIDSAPDDEGILVIGFKDPKDYLRKNLRKLGVDLSQQITVDGTQRPRIQFLTWGQETGRNDMRYCQHVIMAGVLRRNPLDLAASLTGQQQEPQPRRNSRATLAQVQQAEMAHRVLQGVHRAACRVSDEDGEALRTSLLLLVSGPDAAGLRGVLVEAMPGVHWERDCPAPKRRAISRTAETTQAIVQYLTGSDAPGGKVSTAALRKRLNSSLNASTFSDAVNMAIALCAVRGNRWRREGRSLVRGTT
jgi:hypothetical protein